MRAWRIALCALGMQALLLAATPAEAAPHTYTIVLDKLKFGPVPANLHKGDVILWVNRDLFRHSATASDHSFDADLPAGKSAKTVLNRTGTISFVCRYHPGMRGTLVVK